MIRYNADMNCFSKNYRLQISGSKGGYENSAFQAGILLKKMYYVQ